MSIDFTAFNFFICAGVNSAINESVAYLSQKLCVKIGLIFI